MVLCTCCYTKCMYLVPKTMYNNFSIRLISLVSSGFLAWLNQSTYGSTQRWEPKREKESKSPTTKGRFAGRQPSGEVNRQLQPVHWALCLMYQTAEKLLLRWNFSWKDVDVTTYDSRTRGEKAFLSIFWRPNITSVCWWTTCVAIRYHYHQRI